MEEEKEKKVLYFSDLPLSTTEEDIEKFLEEYKEKIVLITLDKNPRNLELKKSLNAKIIISDYNTANKIRIEMNLKKINNHSVRIMWDEKDNSIRYNIKSNLYFKGIPLNISTRKVYEYFLKFGDISSLKIIEDNNGNHFDYGYITYYNNNDAEKAILETNGKKIFDDKNIIEIRHFQKKNDYQIYINNFDQKLNESDLNKICSKYGNIISLNIYQDSIGRNYAILQYNNQESTNNAIKNLINEIPSEKNLKLQIEQKKKIDRNQENKLRESNNILNYQYQLCNLHIRNIPLTAKEEDLEKTFSKYGQIRSIKIERDKLEKNEDNSYKEIPKSKGFGYVCFENQESAKNAMIALNGKYLPSFESWNRPLLIEYFIPKAERQMINNNNFIGNRLFFYSQPMIIRGYNGNYYNGNRGYNNKRGRFKNNYYQNRNNNYGKNKNYNNNKGNSNYKENNYNIKNNKSNINNNDNNKENNNKKNNEDVSNIVKNEIKDFDLESFNKIESEEDKREFLGEQIFKAIENSPFAIENKLDYDIIGKITGMIIGLPDINEVIHILSVENSLNERIKEGYNLLNKDK
jgi:RNA recognition motif-containing protein